MTSQIADACPEPDRGSQWDEEPEHEIAMVVADLIAWRIGIDRCLVVPDAMLVDELGANSLSIMELALSFEETFGIDFTQGEVGQLCTVSDAVRCVRRALRRGRGESKVSVMAGW